MDAQHNCKAQQEPAWTRDKQESQQPPLRCHKCVEQTFCSLGYMISEMKPLSLSTRYTSLPLLISFQGKVSDALLLSMITSWSEHFKTQFWPQSERGIRSPVSLRSVLKKQCIAYFRLLVILQHCQFSSFPTGLNMIQNSVFREKKQKDPKSVAQGFRIVNQKWDPLCSVLLWVLFGDFQVVFVIVVVVFLK